MQRNFCCMLASCVCNIHIFFVKNKKKRVLCELKSVNCLQTVPSKIYSASFAAWLHLVYAIYIHVWWKTKRNASCAHWNRSTACRQCLATYAAHFWLHARCMHFVANSAFFRHFMRVFWYCRHVLHVFWGIFCLFLRVCSVFRLFLVVFRHVH